MPVPSRSEISARSRRRVFLWYSACLGVSALPDAALSAVKLLTHCGVKVIFKQDQTCCGQPAYNTGFTDEARRIARYNVELFSDNDYPIVVPSGSCAGMMSKEYAELFVDADEKTKAQVAAFSARVTDLSQYLVDVSAAMVGDKIRHIKETGVEVVIAADHGCILNISTALHKQGLDHIKVYSLYDFIWQRVSPNLTETIPCAAVGGV